MNFPNTPQNYVVLAIDGDGAEFTAQRGTGDLARVLRKVAEIEQDPSVTVTGIRLSTTGNAVHTPDAIRTRLADLTARF